ncbi:hypothetical protein [Rhodanobacter geophilus]|uniref:Uncharacterized protein n=1 Tax=Rhodanobacter geophilus TaxID=3162488 RepID=A0ABV3QN10_9GAMM
MAYYWRIESIPELCDLVPGDRRKWWREAIAESRSGRDMAIRLGVFFCVIFGASTVADWYGYSSGPVHWASIGCAVALTSWVLEVVLEQPRARRWLRVNLVRQMAREKKLAAV